MTLLKRLGFSLFWTAFIMCVAAFIAWAILQYGMGAVPWFMGITLFIVVFFTISVDANDANNEAVDKTKNP